MVGVFMVMWLAALTTLAASGMQHRQLADRFIAYMYDRAHAFTAANHALVLARQRLTLGEDAAEIAARSEFDAGPHGVIEANHRGDIWFRNDTPRWRMLDWTRSDAVVSVRDARYFIERIAFSDYPAVELTPRAVSIRRYRVSAMGCGKLPGTRVYLQAIYEIRQRGEARRSGMAEPRFTPRLLSWREVTAWHDRETRAARERCDAS
ncbi:hypothetical protein PMO31116_02237 [Pandoraea morbifera]|uniref:PilX/PilW C-terminal domain-containing protein n=1 Tax=Pandoraea morbifera TaxID=2508300 RepID=A0A5E4UVK0_9BURK|nr:hypothetical protein [Pandoraea morbifera]VVE03444.1 hypothetical protein PMO31116_02237 [Pandoraea morbifera]